MTTETIEAPTIVEPTTPIKPSEALRLGRLTRPRRTKGRLLDGVDGACALGAMMTGWGEDPARDEIPCFSQRIISDIVCLFDLAEELGRDGDAAVLAHLEARGL